MFRAMGVEFSASNRTAVVTVVVCQASFSEVSVRMNQGQHQPAQIRSNLTLRNRFLRAIWYIVWISLFRPSPRPFFWWRRFLLRLFGAKIAEGVRVYGTAKIFYPPTLTMDAFSILGPDVDCYCVDKVHIGHHAVVSQYSFLCTASHDYRKPDLPLITAPIKIENQAWIAADSFIAPGVTIGEGAVVGARSSVYRDVPSWVVVGGNPASKLKDRVLDKPQQIPT
jgi:putative colanic acid biosynthesis acetyltransferase WcaF